MAKIKQNIIILLILSSLGLHAQQLILGSERMQEIINSIDNKNLAIVGNQTSLVNDIHLVDTLLSLKQNIVSVFSPEHGFRGTEDAGAKIDNEFDSKTGLPIISPKHKRVSGRIAWRNSSGLRGSTKVVSIPKRGKVCLNRFTLPP